MRLPHPRGPLTEWLLGRLPSAPHDVGRPALPQGDPLTDEDLQLALFVLYELHYGGFEDVDDRWEWEPSLLALRARLERRFEAALREGARVPAGDGSVPELLFALSRGDGPSLSRYLKRRGTPEQFREFVVQRSAYQLREADPHTWAIPRLAGRAKAAMVEIQSDEYGGGDPEWMHSRLFARTMEALGLDPRPGEYLDAIPGVTLATVNLMSLLGLNRRLRGACAGHLALLEMTSSEPMGRYADGLRRLGFGEEATRFYDEHVEADAVHEQLAAHDLAGALAEDEPELVDGILFGAAALVLVEDAFARHLLAAWEAGVPSLRAGFAGALPV